MVLIVVDHYKLRLSSQHLRGRAQCTPRARGSTLAQVLENKEFHGGKKDGVGFASICWCTLLPRQGCELNLQLIDRFEL